MPVRMNDALKFLEKFYLSVINNKALLKSYLLKKELTPLSVDIQEKILELTINSPYTKKYSPPVPYQRFFLRTVLDVVENNGSEISDYLIEAYANNLSLTSSNTECVYRSYIIKDCTVTLQESSCFVTNSTTGLQTWEAAKYLLEWCLENTSLFQNKRILELGSGIGLLGIAVIKMCQPQKYFFTDKSWDVLDMLAKNIEINLEENIMKNVIEKHQLFWGTISSDYATNLTADFILGADIVFDPPVIIKLVETIKKFLDHGKTNCAYIASTIRNVNTNEYFSFQLVSSGLKYEILDFHGSGLFIYNESSKFILYKIYTKEN